jgi:hypothetical protein
MVGWQKRDGENIKRVEVLSGGWLVESRYRPKEAKMKFEYKKS